MARRRADMTEIEREARSYAFRKILKQELGCKCGNCGSEEMVEYHHVVPLSMGGTNNLSNIVPLCYACHKAAHNSRHIQRFADHSRSDDGRPPKCDDETAFRALDLLADGQIGVRKCKQVMNLSARTEPRNTRQFKQWCESRGVADVKNTLDVKITNGLLNLKEGTVIGRICFSDGSRKAIRFKDTGMNDDTVYNLRQGRSAAFSELKDVLGALG